MKKILLWLVSLVTACFLLGAFFYFYYHPTINPVWGINFSPNQARYLGLDPTQTFSAILKDLKPKKIRLVAYWETFEPRQGEFNFSETDALLKAASDNGTKITLVLGKKQPRWPECHVPDW